MQDLSRRRVMRGILNGSAVTVGLPLLNCFLNSNGTALASGKPLPVRFGTWYWGLGVAKAAYVPKTTGTGYALTEETEPFKAVKQHVNVFSDFHAFRDNAESFCHYSGWVIGKTGRAPAARGDRPGETIDVTVANQIGRTSRFKMLGISANGDSRAVQSYENANTVNPVEGSAVQFYTRLFGPDFQDPNAPTFTPNPRTMARKSALSPVVEQIKVMNERVGAEDRERLDQYFTGLRHLEKQFDQMLTKPDPIPDCKAPKKVTEDVPPGTAADLVLARHKAMADLLAMALACDQTRVFHMGYSSGNGGTTRPGYARPHHTSTHEEPLDLALGYQPNCSWFTKRCFDAFASMVDSFSKFKEGDGTLLDNVLVFGNTDHGYARVHGLDNMPALTAGRAGGRIKSGQHIAGKGTSIARIGFTALQAMGVEVEKWGTKSNEVSAPISEMLA